jgi:hypothetical protein
MKLKLVSDFMDYYDHWFDREGQEFRRVTTEGPTRYEMFQTLRDAGYATPPLFLLGPALYEHVHFTKDNFKVVVYLEERSHCGEDKILLSLEDAIEAHPGKWASLYLGDDCPVSMRFLYVGFYEIALDYSSDDEFRSNVGNVQIYIYDIRKVKSRFNYVLPPLCAVDGVQHKGFFKAFDLNIAPGIKGTGVEDTVKAEDLVQSLKDYMSEIDPGQIP